MDLPQGTWQKFIDSSEKEWSGPGSVMLDTVEHEEHVTLRPFSFALYNMEATK